MRILHTSDWHLGQYFMQREQMRKQEHEKFLDWLVDYLKQETIDVLIVAGDIFDTRMPPNYALRMYYSFLHRVSETACKMTVIIGGNHDSVSTLHAPRELLKQHRVHVIGGATATLEEELLIVKDADGEPLGIICAVPFLSDRDVRKFVPGESYEEKSQALVEGVKNHYQEVTNAALRLREQMASPNLPIVATGHLFASGGQTSDGVRDLYVGSLGQISANSFPEALDYVALGHLHIPQKVGGQEHIRYSGSPLALSFSEVGEQPSSKTMLLVDLNASSSPHVTPIEVPEFQKLRRLKGTEEEIEIKLRSLEPPNPGSTIWLEIQVDTTVFKAGIKERIWEFAKDLPVEILAIKPLRKPEVSRFLQQSEETLDELKALDVFKKRLETEAQLKETQGEWETAYTDEEREALLHAFNDVVAHMEMSEES